MKVLMLNGGAKANGNTYASLLEVGRQLEKEGIEYEIFPDGRGTGQRLSGLRFSVQRTAVCFADDKVNEFVAKAKRSRWVCIGTPVYYAHPSGRVMSFLDGHFTAAEVLHSHLKPGASVAVARRGGTTASFDAMNKYFGICQMPVAGSTYWNQVARSCSGRSLFRIRRYADHAESCA